MSDSTAESATIASQATISTSAFAFALLSYESFETLPLDLAKSIADYLPLEEFRLLHCVSHTLMRIAAVGKPRRLRGSDCTPEQISELLVSTQSHLRRHIGGLKIVPSFAKQKEKVNAKEEVEAAKVSTVAADQEALASSQEEKLEEEEEEKEEEIKEVHGDAHPTITCAQLGGLIHSLPQLDVLECHVDMRVVNPSSLESICLPPVTQLLIHLCRIDKFSTQLYNVVSRLFESISRLDRLEYLEIRCDFYHFYLYESDQRTHLIRTLARCAPTLITLKLTGQYIPSSDENIGVHQLWTHDQIAIFREFTRLQYLDVADQWTRDQLEWLLAPREEEQSPFPDLKCFGLDSFEWTDESVSLFSRLLPTLETFLPKSIQSRDCSWLSEMRNLTALVLNCGDQVALPTVIASLAHLTQLTTVGLYYATLSEYQLQLIFTPLKRCTDIRLTLPLMHSLGWFTSLPHLVVSCRSLTLIDCPLLDFGELRRLDLMKQRKEIALGSIKLVGGVSDLTSEELHEMQINQTDWPRLVTFFIAR